jgi:hypothetical protein
MVGPLAHLAWEIMQPAGLLRVLGAAGPLECSRNTWTNKPEADRLIPKQPELRRQKPEKPEKPEIHRRQVLKQPEIHGQIPKKS